MICMIYSPALMVPVCIHKLNGLIETTEPPNRGHFGTAAFVLSSEVVLFSEVV